MHLADVHPSLRELLALHDACRRFGFSSQELFVCNGVFDSRDQPFPALIIRAQGKQFVIPNGKPYEGDDDAFHDAWMAAVTLWNASAEEGDREQIWEHSDILVRAHSLYEVLVRRGFVPRGHIGGNQPC
jgi:hypothetical protein